jgi:nicotinate-nucleotide pyrophosphorylase (carboxylating)
MTDLELPRDLSESIARALAEDIGAGDLTAQLVPDERLARAEIRVREAAVFCGSAWVDAVYRQLDPSISTSWRRDDGQRCAPGAVVCTLSGKARALLSGERTALNFLQTLSGTATITAEYCRAIEGTTARILDTRKTLPGLRLAQKYAVRCGGGSNHRLGLHDAVLIKENHIAAVGSIARTVELARARTQGVMIEVEVETLDQAVEALSSSADRLMLDNFGDEQIREIVRLRDNHPGDRKELEASGNVDLGSVRAIAETGVDFISVGAITKHLKAIDFSMRLL